MKNYYEMLEIDKHASKEIIEKAYKTLAKKYHPDLQHQDRKNEYEKKLKLINEAYETLSDKNKKDLYDKQLQNNYIEIEKYNNILKENIILKNQLNNIQNKSSNNIRYTYSPKNNYQNINSQYYNNEKKYNELNLDIFAILKRILKNSFMLIISFIIVLLALKLPFIKNFLFNFDNYNGLVFIVGIILFLYFINKK